MMFYLLVFIVGLHAGYTPWSQRGQCIGLGLMTIATVARAITTHPYTPVDTPVFFAALAITLAIYFTLSIGGYFAGRGLHRYNTRHHGGA